MAKKKITISQLARMVQEGFLSVTKELKGEIKRTEKTLGKKIGRVEVKVDELEGQMRKGFRSVKKEVKDAREERFGIEAKVANISRKQKKQGKRIKVLEKITS